MATGFCQQLLTRKLCPAFRAPRRNLKAQTVHSIAKSMTAETFSAWRGAQMPERNCACGTNIQGIHITVHRDDDGPVNGGESFIGDSPAFIAQYHRDFLPSLDLHFVQRDRVIGQFHGEHLIAMVLQRLEIFWPGLHSYPRKVEDRTHRDTRAAPVPRVNAFRGEQHCIYPEARGRANNCAEIGECRNPFWRKLGP